MNVMVVRGLLEHVQNKDSQSAELIVFSNFAPISTIVIDGNSLVEFLWLRTSSVFDLSFGGNYQSFCFALRRFVESIRFEAQVQEIAVFFDTFDVSESGFSELTENIRKEIEKSVGLASAIASTHNITKTAAVPPPIFIHFLAQWLLSQIERVKVFQTNGEVDASVAVYAREKEAFCVISNDSDYFIHDVPYVPLASMRLPFMREFSAPSVTIPIAFPLQNVSVNVAGRLFAAGAAPRSLGLQPWHMPYFACLIGCDYIRREHCLDFIIPKLQDMTSNGYEVGAVAEFLQGRSANDLSVASLVSQFLEFSHVPAEIRTTFSTRYALGLSRYGREASYWPLDMSRHLFGLVKQSVLVVSPVFAKGLFDFYPSERLVYVRQCLLAQWDSVFGSVNMPGAIKEVSQRSSGVGVVEVPVGSQQSDFRAKYDLFVKHVQERKDASLRIEPRLEQLLFTLLCARGNDLFSPLRFSPSHAKIVKETKPIMRLVRILIMLCSATLLCSVEELFAISIFCFHVASIQAISHSVEQLEVPSRAPSQWRSENLQFVSDRMYDLTGLLNSALWHICLVNEAMHRPLRAAPEEFISRMNPSLLAKILLFRNDASWKDIQVPEIQDTSCISSGILWVRTIAHDLSSNSKFSILRSAEQLRAELNAEQRNRKRGRQHSNMPPPKFPAKDPA